MKKFKKENKVKIESCGDLHLECIYITFYNVSTVSDARLFDENGGVLICKW